jgi:hypothetical protein
MIGRRTVELHAAFHWICDECGRDNYFVPLRIDLTDQETEDVIRELHELENWEELPDEQEPIDAYRIPEWVTCRECKSRYEPVPPDIE